MDEGKLRGELRYVREKQKRIRADNRRMQRAQARYREAIQEALDALNEDPGGAREVLEAALLYMGPEDITDPV